jgi:hypothetical protein
MATLEPWLNFGATYRAGTHGAGNSLSLYLDDASPELLPQR